MQFDISKLIGKSGTCEEAAEKTCRLTATISYVESLLEAMNESCENVVQVMYVCSIEIHIYADINNFFFHGTLQNMQGVVLNNFGNDSNEIVYSVIRM